MVPFELSEQINRNITLSTKIQAKSSKSSHQGPVSLILLCYYSIVSWYQFNSNQLFFYSKAKANVKFFKHQWFELGVVWVHGVSILTSIGSIPNPREPTLRVFNQREYVLASEVGFRFFRERAILEFFAVDFLFLNFNLNIFKEMELLKRESSYFFSFFLFCVIGVWDWLTICSILLIWSYSYQKGKYVDFSMEIWKIWKYS